MARRTCLKAVRHRFLKCRRPQNSHHSVLAHQNDTLATEGLSDLVHLLGADIVNADDEDGLVVLEEALQLIEVAGLVFGSAPHIFLG